MSTLADFARQKVDEFDVRTPSIETPVGRLFLASASAHPGGGVHGAPGANAARAALLHARLPG